MATISDSLFFEDLSKQKKTISGLTQSGQCGQKMSDISGRSMEGNCC